MRVLGAIIMENISILGMILIIIVLGLIILFVISLTLFIRRLLINSSARSNESNELGKKLDILIEQNEKVISLLTEKK